MTIYKIGCKALLKIKFVYRDKNFVDEIIIYVSDFDEDVSLYIFRWLKATKH